MGLEIVYPATVAPAGAGLTTLNGDATPAQNVAVGAGTGLALVDAGALHTISGVPFAAGTPGIVSDPAAAAAETYLAADNTFKGPPLRLLGKLLGLNLNVVAATPIFVTPGAGFTTCEVVMITVDHCTGAPAGNTVSFGQAAAPADFLAATALPAGLGVGAPLKAVRLFPGINVPYAEYGPGVTFVANVTVGGAAITCDVDVWGSYE